MITRRHIRIKVMHHLYAQQTQPDLTNAVLLSNLNKSLDDVHALFAWDLAALLRLRKEAEDQYERVSNRNEPDQVLLDHIAPFMNLEFFDQVLDNGPLQTLMESAHPQWSDYDTHFRNLWNKLSESELYAQFLTTKQTGPQQKKFLKEVYQEYIAENEFIHDVYEDQHAHWADDLDAAQMMTAKVITSYKGVDEPLLVPALYKDEDDESFGPLLMRAYMSQQGANQKMIEERASNWDSDRIARIDYILMKMCIAEWKAFPEIPIKVSLNEYIDLAKEYSTPKSAAFMNGILDKIRITLQENGQLKKVGRGIIEQ